MTALSLTRLVFNSNLETSAVNNVFAQIEDFLNGVTLTANITITGTLTAATINSTSLTASRALASDASKNIIVSTTTSTELGYVNGVTSAIQTQLNNKQTLDATLTALAAYNTNGLLTQTAADIFTGRTVTGTAGTITITNGDGVSGNPTLTISSSYIGQSSITTLGTIGTGVWQGTLVGATYGGTGVNNGASTITLAGNLVTAGAFSLTLTTSAATNVTLPTSGTLVNSAVTTLSSLVSIGTITTGTWSATTIGVTKGGTGTATQFTAGSIIFAGASGVYSQDNSKLFWDDTNNRLGIGTTTPVATLEVIGTIRATGNTGASLISAYQTGATGNAIFIKPSDTVNGAIIYNTWTTGSGTLQFAAGNATPTMTITDTARIGIGTTSPAAALQIGGTGTLRIAGAASGTGTAAIIDANGDIRPLTSSERYKKNVINLSVDSSFIHKLRSVEYDYINGAGHDFGFIAEEVNELCPLMVNFNIDGEPESIKYSQLTIFLLEEVKRLRFELDFMKT